MTTRLKKKISPSKNYVQLTSLASSLLKKKLNEALRGRAKSKFKVRSEMCFGPISPELTTISLRATVDFYPTKSIMARFQLPPNLLKTFGYCHGSEEVWTKVQGDPTAENVQLLVDGLVAIFVSKHEHFEESMLNMDLDAFGRFPKYPQ